MERWYPLNDDGTKILAVNVLNYLNINLENAIILMYSENMLDWYQTSKARSLNVDTYIEEVGSRSSKNSSNKVPKNSILGACENPHKGTDCYSVFKKTRISFLNINSLPNKFDDIKALVIGMLDIVIG